MNLGEESRYGLPAVLINTGTLPLVYSVLEDLPRGVVFNPATRFLEATPTRLQEEQDYTLQAKDSARPQRTDTLNFAIEVVRPRPGLVTNLISTPARGNWSIVWQAPLNAVPAAVDGYDAQYREIGTIPWISLEPSIFFVFFFTVSVMGIDETTNYESRVRAKSSRTGLVGEWSMIETLFIILAPLPTALGMDGISYDGVRLYWTAPTTDTARVRGYRVEWRAVGNSTWSGTNLTGIATTEYTPTLASETTYQWRVRSWALHGFTDSAWVEGSNFTTLIRPNQLPTVQIIGPSTVTGGAMAQISATARDVDGTIDSYVWSVSAGSVSGSLAVAIFTAPAATTVQQEVTISCTVTDDDGATASDAIRILVPAEDQVYQYLTVYQLAATLPNVPASSTGIPAGWFLLPPSATTTQAVYESTGRRVQGSGAPYVYTTVSIYRNKVTAISYQYSTVYQLAVTPPSPPVSSTGVPTGWFPVPPSATTTQAVYQSTGRRVQGSSANYVYTTVSIYRNKVTATVYEYRTVYRLAATEPSPPSSSTGIPTGWTVQSDISATTTQAVYESTGRRVQDSGAAVPYVYTTVSLYRNKVVPVVYQYRTVYRRAATLPSVPTSSTGTPTGWSLQSDLSATTTLAVWKSTGQRVQGSSANYVYGAVSIHRNKVLPTEYTPYYYQRGTSTPSTPAAGTGQPSGWSSSNPGATTTNNVYRTRGSRQGSSGNYTFATPSLYRNKVEPIETIGPYYRRGSSRPSTPSPGSGQPSGWSSSSPGVTSSLDVWTTTGSRTGSSGNYSFDTPTIYERRTPATEYTSYYYRRGTSTPGTPNPGRSAPQGWTTSVLSVTTTQNVYRTRGSRQGSSGNYTFSSPSLYASATGITPTEYTPYYYQRGTSTPSTPAAGTGQPSGWSSSNPGATTTNNVYRTRGSRQGSSGNYTFATPSLYRNKVVTYQYKTVYRRADTLPSVPTSSTGTPTGWSLQSDLSATTTLAVWKSTGQRVQGSSANYVYGAVSIHRNKLLPTEYTSYYYRRGTSTPSTPSPNSGVTPQGWSSSTLSATTTQNVYRTRGSRQGSSGNYTFATPSLYRNKVVTYQYKTVYRRADTLPSVPTSSTGTPTGWSLQSDLSATTTLAVWKSTGQRVQGSSANYVYGAVSIHRNKLLPTEYTSYYYRRGTSTPSTPSPNSGVTPQGWSSSTLSATTTQNVYRTRGSRQGSSGNYTFATPSLYRNKVEPIETIGPYYRRASSRPGTPNSGTSTPQGWSSSSPGATSSLDVWTTTGSRRGSSGSYSFSRPTIHERRVTETTIGPFYRSAFSQPSTPSRQTGSSAPSGWSSTKPGASPASIWTTTGRRQGSDIFFNFDTPSVTS